MTDFSFDQEAKEAEAFEAEVSQFIDAPQVEEKAATPEPEGDVVKEAGETDEGNNDVGEAKPEESREQKEESPEVKGDEPQPGKKKPPAGYVEIQALTETRAQMKKAKEDADALKAENEALAIQLQQMMAIPKEEEPEFKELSKAELDHLKEADPDEYTEYKFQLLEHRERQRERAEEASRAQAIERISLRDVVEASEEVNSLTEDPEFVSRLIDHGTATGFSESDLEALSQPQTKIVMGDGKTRYLGKAAVAFIKSLNQSLSTDRKTLESEIEAKIRPRLEEEITRKVLGKVKNPEIQQSLSGQEDKQFKKQLPAKLTEAQFAKLSKAEQDAWLRDQ